jgi:hypothetical protein
MDDQTVLLFKRIKESPDGPEFIEHLAKLSKANYFAFKSDKQEYNEWHKGYANCVDNLIDSFEQCEQIINNRMKIEVINEI